MASNVIVTRMEEMTPKHEAAHDPYEYFKYAVTPHREDGQCYVALYEIPPNRAGYPYHYHRNSTEVFYIIRGEGILRTPEGEHLVKAGDIILCPPAPEGAHKLTNASATETLTYLDVDTTNVTDVISYPDSGKTGVIVHGHSTAFYPGGADVDYYEGE